MSDKPLSISKKAIYSLFTGVGMILFSFFILILVLHFTGTPSHFKGSYAESFFIDDPVTGYAAKPCETFSSVKMLNNDTIYQTHYTINCSGNRTTGPNAKQSHKYLMFFGCSFTFGEGLPDSLSFPYLVNETSKLYKVINYSQPGYGPQQMLAMMQSGNIDTVLRIDSGIAVYTLLPDHLYRAVGAPYVIGNWGDRMPCYKLESGKPINVGSFKQQHPLKALYYKALAKSGVGKLMRWGEPKYSKADLQLTASIISRSRDIYLTASPNSKFVVLLYPFPDLLPLRKDLKTALEQEDITILDYQDLFPMDSAHTIVGDGHPNGLANQLVAKQLVRDLDL